LNGSPPNSVQQERGNERWTQLANKKSHPGKVANVKV